MVEFSTISLSVRYSLIFLSCLQGPIFPADGAILALVQKGWKKSRFPFDVQYLPL